MKGDCRRDAVKAKKRPPQKGGRWRGFALGLQAGGER